MRRWVRSGLALVTSFLVFFGPSSIPAVAAAYTPFTYNLTYLQGVSSANFDRSGTLIGELTGGLSESYMTYGPNAGQARQFITSGGQGSVIYEVYSPPTFNPGPLPSEQGSAVAAGNSSGQEIGVSFPENKYGETGQHGWFYS